MQQGAHIPCLDCQILEATTREACPSCRGAGEVFQPARMASPDIQADIARERRARLAAARDDDARRRALRGALTEALLYGPWYVAALEGARQDTEAADADVDACVARLRDAILELG